MANKSNRHLKRDTDELLAVLTSGEYADGSPFALPVSEGDPPDVAEVTHIEASTSPVQLVPANENRKGLSIYNNSEDTLFMAFSALPTDMVFTLKIEPSGYFELPVPIYTGVINAVWSGDNGQANITEVT